MEENRLRASCGLVRYSTRASPVPFDMDRFPPACLEVYQLRPITPPQLPPGALTRLIFGVVVALVIPPATEGMISRPCEDQVPSHIHPPLLGNEVEVPSPISAPRDLPIQFQLLVTSRQHAGLGLEFFPPVASPGCSTTRFPLRRRRL